MLPFALPFKLKIIEKLKGQSNYTWWVSLVFRILKFYDLNKLATTEAELPT